jgi:hypothetical protein
LMSVEMKRTRSKKNIAIPYDLSTEKRQSSWLASYNTWLDILHGLWWAARRSGQSACHWATTWARCVELGSLLGADVDRSLRLVVGRSLGKDVATLLGVERGLYWARDVGRSLGVTVGRSRRNGVAPCSAL